MVQNNELDTIVAMATPPGYGGVGVVRVSGSLAASIAEKILHKCPPSHQAKVSRFLNQQNEVIDEGIALFFKGPNSFTGEDVLELQGHGGPVVIQMLIREITTLGARLARPGEFSERAFLNNKMDLVQAEAVSDLIHASSEQAAKSALKSLSGKFSSTIQNLVEELILLRMQVEASIDFPDEELELAALQKLEIMLNLLRSRLDQVFKEARVGALLSEGAKIVILGPPNAGKSSLLNALTGVEAAIVTDIPGTTRDLLKEKIKLDGLLLELVDTAGLRESFDIVEQQGIKRALEEIKKADHIVFVLDASQQKNLQSLTLNLNQLFPEWIDQIPKNITKTILYNKIDLLPLQEQAESNIFENLKAQENGELCFCYVSAKTGQGLDAFREHLKKVFGFNLEGEGTFTARTRHLEALKACKVALEKAGQQLIGQGALELMAEELKEAQKCLDEITGKFSSDDLLGRIFSQFCIGK